MRNVLSKKNTLLFGFVMIGFLIIGTGLLLRICSVTAYAGNLPFDASGSDFVEEEIWVDVYDPTVVPDNLIRSSGARKLRKGRSGESISEFTSFGDQLEELSGEVYTAMVEYYAVQESAGNQEHSFDYRSSSGSDSNNIFARAYSFGVLFPATITYDEKCQPVLNEDGNKYTIDKTSEGYKRFTYLIQSAVDAFTYDHPEVFWYRPDGYASSCTYAPVSNIEAGKTYTTYGFVSSVLLKMKEAYPGDYGERTAFKQGVSACSAELNDVEHSDFDEDGQVSDLEYIQAAHDYIIQRMSYDHDSLATYQSTGNYRIFTAAGAFLENGSRKFVCEGYSKSMKILLNERGIPCCLIAGETGSGAGHMWNAVCLDGSWYLLDCTWDDDGDNPNNAGYYADYLVPALNNRTSSGRFSDPDLADAQTFLYPSIASIDTHVMEQVENGASVCTSRRKYQCMHEDGIAYWLPAPGHTWDTAYTEDQPATCTQEGLESLYCSACGAIKEGSSRAIEKLPHPYGDWKTVTEPTCTKAGSKKKECPACGDTVTEVIPVIEHPWNTEYTIDREATCTLEGQKSIYCSACGVKKEGSAIPVGKTAHSWDKGTITQEVTPYQNGQKKYTCSSCKTTRMEEILPTAEDVVGWIEGLPEMSGAEEEAVVAAIRNAFSKLPAAEQAKVTQQSAGKLEKAEQQVTAAKQKKDGQGAQQGQNTQTPAQTKTLPTEKKEDNTLAADGTAVGKGASVSAAEKAIVSAKSDEGPKGSQFSTLALRQKKAAKNSVTVTWNKISGATYTVYGNACGKPFKKLKTLSGTSFIQKKLKKGTYYKYLVVASKNGKVVSTSKTVHVATTGGKAGNPKKITVNQGSLKLKKKKSFRIKSKQAAASKKLKVKTHRKITYESGNPKVVSVSAKGKVKALKKGKAVIYVYAQNGICVKVKVTVS